MKHRVLLILTASLATSPAFAWGDCAFKAERRLEIDAASLAQLEVRAGAGDLEIRGEPGLARAIAVGQACASSPDLLDKTQLVRTDEKGRPVLAAELPETEGGWLNNNYAYMDLVVRVPAKLALTVRDSSGDAEIIGVAALAVTDSSGDLTAREIAGPVSVDDSSGDVDLSQTGAVTIEHDSSGDLQIAEVDGDVTINNDSSGDIEVRDVRGNALVRSDSSGGIEFEQIRGNAEVGSDSSGEISAHGIGGDFIVRSDGSGGISHDDVDGRVQIPDDED